MKTQHSFQWIQVGKFIPGDFTKICFFSNLLQVQLAPPTFCQLTLKLKLYLPQSFSGNRTHASSSRGSLEVSSPKTISSSTVIKCKRMWPTSIGNKTNALIKVFKMKSLMRKVLPLGQKSKKLSQPNVTTPLKMCKQCTRPSVSCQNDHTLHLSRNFVVRT